MVHRNQTFLVPFSNPAVILYFFKEKKKLPKKRNEPVSHCLNQKSWKYRLFSSFHCQLSIATEPVTIYSRNSKVNRCFCESIHCNICFTNKNS